MTHTTTEVVKDAATKTFDHVLAFDTIYELGELLTGLGLFSMACFLMSGAGVVAVAAVFVTMVVVTVAAMSTYFIAWGGSYILLAMLFGVTVPLLAFTPDSWFLAYWVMATLAGVALGRWVWEMET